jgi:hypothetical protein
MRTIILVLCALLFLCGCQSGSKLDSGDFDTFLRRAASSKKQSGDFGTFFTQQVARYGGHTVSSSAPPALRGSWYFESDRDGFGAQLYHVSFEEVQSFMQQVYGSPRDVSTSLDSQPHGLYGVPEIGVGIQFFGDTNGVGFICLLEAEDVTANNQSRQPTPGERHGRSRAPLARRGCADR